MKLYQIPIEAEDIEAELAENYGELTPELAQRISEFVRGSKEKIEAGAVIARSLEADAECCKAEAKRLQERAAGLEKGASRLKGLVLAAVDHGFDGKVKTAKFTIWSQSSVPTVAFDVAEGHLLEGVPAEFLRRKLELNWSALQEAHKAGKELPGGIVVIHNPGTRYLRIR